MKLKERVKQLKSELPAIFLALKAKDTPIVAKIMAGITIGYALSPIDLIPDFIPVIGYLDDIILLPLFARWTIALIPDEVLERCRYEARDLWKDGKPKKWYYSVPIVVFWLFMIYIIIKAIR